MKCYQLREKGYYNTFDTFLISEAEIHPLLPRQQNTPSCPTQQNTPYFIARKTPLTSEAGKHLLLQSKENTPYYRGSKTPFTSEAAKHHLTLEAAKHPLPQKQTPPASPQGRRQRPRRIRCSSPGDAPRGSRGPCGWGCPRHEPEGTDGPCGLKTKE